MAVVVCSNEDGISLIGPLSRQIADLLLGTAPAQELAQVRGILEGLAQGRVDRSLFTADANAYFTEAALQDFSASLQALGKLQEVTKTSEPCGAE